MELSDALLPSKDGDETASPSMDGDETASGHPGSGSALAKKMSVLAIALLCFSCVAGGPFGIEAAVQAAGALPTIVALFLAGACWGAPQALITAELSAAMPENGGPVVWTRAAFGDAVSFVVSLLLVLNQVADICLYPTLVASYFRQLFPHVLSGMGVYAVKMAALGVTVALNVVGIEAISASAVLLTAVILAPFLALPIVAAAEGRTFDWAAVGPAGVAPGVTGQLALFVSTVLWNMQGWSEIGCMAGEIAEVERVMPPGLLLAALLVVVAYATPVLFGVALSPDLAQWEAGFLLRLATNVAPWLGVAVLVSAALANMSTFLVSMAAYARTLQAAARQGMLPLPLLRRNWTRWKTPVPAILLLAASTSALGLLRFEDLVVVDSSFFVLSNMVIQAGWLRLRYTQPDMPRPYRFPGGNAGAWAALACTESIALFSLYAVTSGAPVSAAIVGASVVVLGLLSLVWVRCGKCGGGGSVDDEDGDEDVQPEGQGGERAKAALIEQGVDRGTGAPDRPGNLSPCPDSQALDVAGLTHASQPLVIATRARPLSLDSQGNPLGAVPFGRKTSRSIAFGSRPSVGEGTHHRGGLGRASITDWFGLASHSSLGPGGAGAGSGSASSRASLAAADAFLVSLPPTRKSHVEGTGTGSKG